jgi:hypothetical protein
MNVYPDIVQVNSFFRTFEVVLAASFVLLLDFGKVLFISKMSRDILRCRGTVSDGRSCFLSADQAIFCSNDPIWLLAAPGWTTRTPIRVA